MLFKKADYKISLQKNTNYSTKEKQNIMRSSYMLKELIYEVLDIEAPIHIDECFTRIVKHLRIKSAMQYYSKYKRLLNQEIKTGNIFEKNKFLYLKDTIVVIRNRNTSYYEKYCGKLNADFIPPDELIKIAKVIIQQSCSIQENELAKIIMQEIGFTRMTQKIKEVILRTFELLKKDQEVCFKKGRFQDISINVDNCEQYNNDNKIQQQPNELIDYLLQNQKTLIQKTEPKKRIENEKRENKPRIILYSELGKYCPVCGEKIYKNKRYCPNCTATYKPIAELNDIYKCGQYDKANSQNMCIYAPHCVHTSCQYSKKKINEANENNENPGCSLLFWLAVVIFIFFCIIT